MQPPMASICEVGSGEVEPGSETRRTRFDEPALLFGRQGGPERLALPPATLFPQNAEVIALAQRAGFD